MFANESEAFLDKSSGMITIHRDLMGSTMDES
jgi:hypothetical protein